MSEKLAKQVWTVCIILFICILVNFVAIFMFSSKGGGDAKLRKDLNEAYNKIDILERQIAGISTGENGEGKSISYELLEGRVAILERNGVGSDANIDRRLSQLEMMVSTLEIAFKQATGVNPNATASANRQPTTTANNTTTTTPPTGNRNPQPTQTTASTNNNNGGGNRTPIQIQTGPSQPSANAKYHTVQPGENLFRISQKYGLTVEQLRKLNNMKESDVLKAGQKLIVSN